MPSDLGRKGENLACEYLVEKGFGIIERNFRRPWGELDIVAVSPDKTLVFMEVKTVSSADPANISAEDQMTAAKIKKFKRAAEMYAGIRPELVKDDKGFRLDLIAITVTGGKAEIKHYENAV